MTAWMVGKSRLSTASTVSRPRPGQAEHAFGHDRAADQQGDADADHGQDRHGGVAQRMAHQHDAVG